MKTPYETLGVKKTDSKDKIKKAYRKKSLKAHPDQGGDSVEFDSINKAYRVLVDDDKRARFDKGENVDDILKSTQTQEEKSLTILKTMFSNVVLSVDPDSKNIIKMMKGNLEEGISNVATMIRNEEGKKKKFEAAIKRLKSKNNMFKEVATGQMDVISRNIESAERSKKDFVEAIKLLEDFSYEVDEEIKATVDFRDVFSGRIQSGWL